MKKIIILLLATILFGGHSFVWAKTHSPNDYRKHTQIDPWTKSEKKQETQRKEPTKKIELPTILKSVKDGTYHGSQIELSFWKLGQSKRKALQIAQKYATENISHESGIKLEVYYMCIDIESYRFSIKDGINCTVELLFYNDRILAIKLRNISNDVDSLLHSFSNKYGPVKDRKWLPRGKGRTFCIFKFVSTNNPLNFRFNASETNNRMYMIDTRDEKVMDALEKYSRNFFTS